MHFIDLNVLPSGDRLHVSSEHIVAIRHIEGKDDTCEILLTGGNHEEAGDWLLINMGPQQLIDDIYVGHKEEREELAKLIN